MLIEISQFKNWLICQSPTSSTRIHYTSDLVLFFAWAMKSPAEIDVRVVDDFIVHCQQQGYAPATINRRLAALNTFYYFLAMTEDNPPANPVVPRRHSLPKTYPLPRDLRDEDVETLFGGIENPRERAIFLLMLDCGLRVGEIHNLSFDDISLDSPPRLRVHGKGDRHRTVYLSPQAQDALHSWLNCRPVTTDRAVFLSQRGKRLSVAGIQFILRNICKKKRTKNHLPPVPPHFWAAHCRSGDVCHHFAGATRPREFAHHPGLCPSLQPTPASRIRPGDEFGAGGAGMTLSTGRRKTHFKYTQPTDPNIIPFGEWLPANRRFHADFCLWLKQGGYSASTLRTYSVGARLALGFLDKPIEQIDIERDFQHVRVHLASRPLSLSTRAGYEKGLNKLAQYLRLQRNIPEPEKTVNWEGYFRDLPEWLADSIRAYVEYRSRNWNADNRVQLARNLLVQLCGFARMPHPASLPDITPKRWFAYLSERTKVGIKPSTLNTLLRHLQSFLRFLQESGQLICERMLGVCPQKTCPAQPRDVPIPDIKTLLQANLPSFDRAWLLLMLHSGLRTCEIRRLKWESVDLERRTLRIEQSKGQKDRIVFLSLPTVGALRAWPRASALLFTRYHRPLNRCYCQSRLKTFGRTCDVKTTPHQLRHTAATLLLNAGMSVWGVKAILGHRHVETTLRYAQTYNSQVAKEYQLAIAHENSLLA